MNILNRNGRSVRLLLILSASLLAGQALAKTTTTKDLIADLRKSLVMPAGTPANPALANASRYIDQVDAQLNQLRFAEAEQILAQLRTALPADNTKAIGLIEKLLADVQARVADATAKQDAAYDAIAKDFVAKFEAKAPAADFDALLKRLAALPPLVTSNNPNAQKVEMLRNFVTRWQDYLLQTASGNLQQASQSLNEVVQLSARMPIVPRSRLAKLQAETAARLNAPNEAVDARWDALRKKLAITIDSAKSASDFDLILAEIAKSIPGNRSSTNSQMGNLRRMVLRWQDYYSQLDAGNGTAAQNVLKELSNDPSAEEYYPRSRILARLNGKDTSLTTDPDATDPLIAPEKLTLDNLDQFARQLVARRPTDGRTNGLEDLTTEAGRLRSVAQQVRFGNPRAVLAQINNPTVFPRLGNYATPLAAIQHALLLRSLPRLLEAPPEIQPSPQDSVESYNLRLIQYGREKKDWALVYRVLSTETKLRQGLTFESPDLQAYRNFFTAMQQEKAGVWRMAVRSYFAAMRIGAPNLPAEEIGIRLAQLKSDHPEDYAAAEKFPNGEPINMPSPYAGRGPAGQPVDANATIQAGMLPPGYTVDLKTGRLIPEALPVPPAKEPAQPSPAPAVQPESPKTPEFQPSAAASK